MKPKTTAQKLADAQKMVSDLEAKLEKEQLANQPKLIYEEVTTLPGIYKKLNCNPKKDVVKVDKFDKTETKCVLAFIERIRIAKVYRGGKKPLGFGVKRWYPWSLKNSAGAGLVFALSTCRGDCASLTSAACLSFIDEASSDAYFKNFKSTEERLLQLK